MNRRALLGSLGALLFSAGAAIGVSRLAARPSAPAVRRRVVSLTPAITETVLALGAGPQLVGVSDYCELPPGSALPRLGSSLTPQLEQIAALRPSLILSDGSAAAKSRELSALGKTEVLPWLTLAEVTASIRRLGQLLEQAAVGDALAQKLHDALSRPPPPGAPRVLLLLSYDPDRPAELWFIRRNSLHGAALAAAGAQNAVAHDVAGLPRLSVEELVRLDPDQVLIIPSPGATLEARQRILGAFSRLSPLRAVKESRVGVLSGASQSVGPGILRLVDSVGQMLQKMSGPRPAGGFVE
ncbi:MAG: ABC transporter substrate-binding protein [Myxococcales bacterium]|nr:MAG: ABC transporter substrate-binding protein [Myxococcales bacterium]